MYVYLVKHPQKGVIYVGKTNDIDVRISQHMRIQDAVRLKQFMESDVYYLTESDEKEAANLEAVLIHGLMPEYNVRKEIVRHDIGWIELKHRCWTRYKIPEWLLHDKEEYMNMLIHNFLNAFERYVKEIESED